MDSSTETTLLLVLGLMCVATLVFLSIKEDEDVSGIRAGIQARVWGSRGHGGQRQVSKHQFFQTEVANAQQGRHRRTVATVLRWNRQNSELEQAEFGVGVGKW